MIEIKPYTEIAVSVWNEFVRNAKNSHFMFFRDYMDYHADRFTDCSVMVYATNKLVALLPANVVNQIVYSHQGLTFGGFVIGDKMKAKLMLEIFAAVCDYFKGLGYKKIIYKAIPYIYHRYPAQEDLYALFRRGAVLVRRDVSSAIQQAHPLKFSGQRKRDINKAKINGVVACDSQKLEEFWKLLESVLVRQHQAKPVHSLDEIQRLQQLFPENILLYTAEKENNVLAGVLIYETDTVAHTQYMACGEAGRACFALDFLLNCLITDKYQQKLYFDFGISNEKQGAVLNEGLIYQKESFGARAVCHDFYEVNL